MKSSMKYIFLLFVLVGLLNSCTEKIDLDLNDDEEFQRLVVAGWFTDEPSRQRVDLTLTTSYLQNESAPRALGAVVSVTDGETSWNYTETDPGVYETEDGVFGEPERSYTLSIDFEDKVYSATSFMRTVAPIDSIAFEFIEEEDEEDPDYYDVFIWTQELEGIGDSYMWLTEINGEPLRDTLTEIGFVEDEIYDGSYIDGAQIEYIDLVDGIEPGDEFTIKQYNIGREAYDVFIGIMNETEWNGGLFDAPPANVNTNLTGGALGYWGAAGVSSKSGLLPPP